MPDALARQRNPGLAPLPQDPLEVDIVIIGSGAAGLMAALTAAESGARALVMEASSLIGGTTAFSGGLLWVPYNKVAAAHGFSDSRAVAERYVARCLGQRAQDPRWRVFFDHINGVIEFLEQRARIRFLLTRYPDSFSEWDEGRDCRHINIAPFNIRSLGSWRARIRKPPGELTLLTIPDIEASTEPMSVFTRMALARLALIAAKRTVTGEVTMGYALVAAMLRACLQRRVDVRLNTRVVRLVEEDHRIIGVIAETANGERCVLARQGVVLACGGFDWNEELKSKYLPGAMDATQTPPVNNGDNLHLVRPVNALLGSTDEAWYLPGYINPEAVPYEGRLLGTSIIADRMLPHTLWVNRFGRRFVNEGAQNAANSFYLRDPATGELPNLPCFSVFDSQYRRKYPVLMFTSPDHPDPPWLEKSDTLEGLAERLGIDGGGLRSAVYRFNQYARRGEDPDFHRGEGGFERYFGDPSAPQRNLGTIEEPPFYAFRVHQSSVGTKGGAMSNCHGQILRESGEPIAGLYGAGNAAAAFNGPLTVAAGCTIPPALTMAYVAVLHAVGTGSAAGPSSSSQRRGESILAADGVGRSCP